MTNVAEIIAEIRKPGKVEVPVLVAGDVIHLLVEKTDLLESFTRQGLRPSDKSPWMIIHRENGVLTLDVQD